MSPHDPVYCGKCGTLNPSGNAFCRSCGHRLADDIVPPGTEPEATGGDPGAALVPPEPPVVNGVELRRYPVVDPESGEPLQVTLGAPREEVPPEQPGQRRGLFFWAVLVHLAAILVATVLAVGVIAVVERDWLARLNAADPSQVWSQQWALLQRANRDQMTQEQIDAELRRVLQMSDPATQGRIQVITHVFVLLGFLFAGLVVGRRRRPERLVEVGLAAMLAGVMAALCCGSPLAAIVGSLLSVGGAALGRRLGS